MPMWVHGTAARPPTLQWVIFENAQGEQFTLEFSGKQLKFLSQ